MLLAGTEPRVKERNEWVMNSIESYKQRHVHVVILETLAEGALYWNHMFLNVGIHRNSYLNSG